MTQPDYDILRKLAEEWALAAQNNDNRNRFELWRNLNDLKPCRPMIWITELPWSELSQIPELTLESQGEYARMIEDTLRKNLYQWKYFPGDMILEPFFDLPPFIEGLNFGLDIQEEKIMHGDIASHEYRSLIKTMEDAEKIVAPKLSINQEKADAYYETASAAFGDILPLREDGIPTWWFAPWDWITMRWKVEDALLALVLEPELVHLVMQRFLDASLSMLNQMQDMKLLRYHTGNYRVGSGGMGCTSALENTEEPVSPSHQWGCAVAQIFGEVSPAMHEEFALRYERQWMQHFALNYYGCCEPLHNKVELMRTIPNLRKISASPWCNLESLISQTNNDYVLSLKPSPSVFAMDKFDLSHAESELRHKLTVLQGANVEVIMKDVSTVRNEPERIGQWMTMTKRVCLEFA